MRCLHVITGARALGLLALLIVLGVAATTVWATPPGKNGQIMFRRYLDPAKTTGALFSMNPDGTRREAGHQAWRGGWRAGSTTGRPTERSVLVRTQAPLSGRRRPRTAWTTPVIASTRSGATGKGLKALVPCGFKVRKPFPGTCVGTRTPSWSPDGSMIAFRYALVDDVYVDSFTTNIGIWIVNADGTARRQVTQRTPGSWSGTASHSGGPTGRSSSSSATTSSGRQKQLFTVKH